MFKPRPRSGPDLPPTLRGVKPLCLRFSSPLCGEFEGDAAAAEVDHGDDGGGGVVAVAAVVDEADFGVGAFEFPVGESELDGCEDAVSVVSDGLGEPDECGDAAAAGPGEPPVEVGWGVGGVGEPVEV